MHYSGENIPNITTHSTNNSVSHPEWCINYGHVSICLQWEWDDLTTVIVIFSPSSAQMFRCHITFKINIKFIKNIHTYPSILKEEWEYLYYYTEDEYLESAPNFKAKHIKATSFENGKLITKHVSNLDINKINSQSLFSVKFSLSYF